MIYLAYQADEIQFTEERIIRIVEEFFNYNLEEIKERLKRTNKYQREKKVSFLESSSLAGHFLFGTIKNIPWTPIGFRYHYNEENAKCPKNFTGLSIYPNHYSSEDFLRVLNIKPEVDIFLSSIGISWQDRHQLNF
jgi:hypothetical protein